MASSSRSEEEDPYSWKKHLPIGIKFRPTDQELLLEYLKIKFEDKPITPGIISEEEIYEYPPEILQDKAFKHDDGRMYFFTNLKGKDNSKSKKERFVKKIGYWKATQARTDVHDDDNRKHKIGTKTPLAYFHSRVREDGSREGIKQNWLMTEYRLPEKESADEELALCVIYHHEKKRKKS
ncbi:hypothetical protein ACH5RR_003687 [Cinchona calisaya]|uniref:NAC domain-containing protein n=1 Tax=Cinchona calisaya TaxID=153742 RepID=A0ABD3AVI7_9GENT